jgi:hypothetical protein
MAHVKHHADGSRKECIRVEAIQISCRGQTTKSKLRKMVSLSVSGFNQAEHYITT